MMRAGCPVLASRRRRGIRRRGRGWLTLVRGGGPATVGRSLEGGAIGLLLLVCSSVTGSGLRAGIDFAIDSNDGLPRTALIAIDVFFAAGVILNLDRPDHHVVGTLGVIDLTSRPFYDS